MVVRLHRRAARHDRRAAHPRAHRRRAAHEGGRRPGEPRAGARPLSPRQRHLPDHRAGPRSARARRRVPPRPRRWRSDGYLPAVPPDPWGHPYVYAAPTAGTSPCARSAADGGAAATARRPTWSRDAPERGFTLLETLLALLIGGLVLTAAYAAVVRAAVARDGAAARPQARRRPPRAARAGRDARDVRRRARSPPMRIRLRLARPSPSPASCADASRDRGSSSARPAFAAPGVAEARRRGRPRRRPGFHVRCFDGGAWVDQWRGDARRVPSSSRSRPRDGEELRTRVCCPSAGRRLSMRLVGIEIGADELRVAWGERGLGAARLTAVEPRAARPRRESLRTALAAACSRAAPEWSSRRCRSPAPRIVGSRCPFGIVPASRNTAPLELLGQLPLGADDTVVATRPLGVRRAAPRCSPSPSSEPRWRRTRRFTARACRRRRSTSPRCRRSRCCPDGDVALVVADGGASALVVRHAGRIAGLRALGATRATPRVRQRGALDAARLGGAARTSWRVRTRRASSRAGRRHRRHGRRPRAAAALAGDADPAEVSRCAVAAGLMLGEGRGDGAGMTIADMAPARRGAGGGRPRWPRWRSARRRQRRAGAHGAGARGPPSPRRHGGPRRGAAGDSGAVARAQLEEAVAARRRLRPAGDCRCSRCCAS